LPDGSNGTELKVANYAHNYFAKHLISGTVSYFSVDISQF